MMKSFLSDNTALLKKICYFRPVLKLKTMKRKSLPKSLFLIAAVFSLTAFLFVNVHANLTIPQQQVCTQTGLEQPQVKECNDTDEQEVKLPDVSILGRVLELALKFIPVAN